MKVGRNTEENEGKGEGDEKGRREIRGGGGQG